MTVSCCIISVIAVQDMIASKDKGSSQMHTCAPPKDEFQTCFEETVKRTDGLWHTLLEQTTADEGPLAAALIPYFESAHLDARILFHEYMGIDLHPDADESKDADGSKPDTTYPGALPTKARRGLFGEVLAGLLTESYEYIGEHSWMVPVFLFRFHEDARDYLFTLVRNPDRIRQVIGRHGTDFFGISLNDAGEVVRMISGEAKWRKSPTPAEVDALLLGEWKDDGAGGKKRSGKGVWRTLNDETNPLKGARQLQQVLKNKDPDKFDAAIYRLEKALVPKNPEPIPNTNLIVVAGNSSAKRSKGDCLLPRDKIPVEYTVKNDLQIMEVVFEEGDSLIDTIYNGLWVENEDART